MRIVLTKLFFIMLSVLVTIRSYKFIRHSFGFGKLKKFNDIRLFSTVHENTNKEATTNDVMITGLNGVQDISVKVVSCREIVQEVLRRNSFTPLAAKHLGELLACSIMMGSGLKGEETQQINLVGIHGLKNIMSITDGDLKIRGMVGNPQFALEDEAGTDSAEVSMDQLLGPGEIQIVRSHPAWKHPMNGITELRNLSIPLNLALYMAESEQRPTAMITDVRIEGNTCIAALAVMIETLPGATNENIENSITNLNTVQKKGLFTYFTENNNTQPNNSQESTDNNDIKPMFSSISGGEITSEQQQRAEALFTSLDSPLDRILDDCLQGMDSGSIRWEKQPIYQCTCGVDKVWRALRLLPIEEVQDIVKQDENVEVLFVTLLLTLFVVFSY